MSESPVVIDAGIAILRVLNTPARPAATALWDQFLHEETVLYVPRLWCYEITSVMHRYLFDRLLTAADAADALEVMFAFGVNVVEEDEALCLAAFHWATRLGQRPAYDAFYLALAEKLGVGFWTADRRLYNNARQAGAGWIHLMGEAG